MHCRIWCSAPYAAVHTLGLLMMGIMMPKTCSGRSLVINIRLVASCRFLSLHPTSQKIVFGVVTSLMGNIHSVVQKF